MVGTYTPTLMASMPPGAEFCGHGLADSGETVEAYCYDGSVHFFTVGADCGPGKELINED